MALFKKKSTCTKPGTPVPDAVPYNQTEKPPDYKLPPPPFSAEKLRADLQRTAPTSTTAHPGFTTTTSHTLPQYGAAPIMNSVRNPCAALNTPAITFWRRWEALMRYGHMVDTKWISPIWFELSASPRDNFRPTLEDSCRATARHLQLYPPSITHRVADMVRKVRFSKKYYAPLMAGAITFFFVAHTALAADKLRPKDRM